MYSYNQLFIGIPLSQLDGSVKPLKSKLFIDSLVDILNEDLNIERIDDYLEEPMPEEVHLFLSNINKYRNENKEFQNFISNQKLDFHISYNGAGESPIIFGIYIDHLMPMPSFDVSPFVIELEQMESLKKEFLQWLKLLLKDKTYTDLVDDHMIGIFYNNHSS